MYYTNFDVLFFSLSSKYFKIFLLRFLFWLRCSLEVSCFSSVQFSRSVVSNSLRPCGLQHIRPHCPSPTPAVYSNSCPSSRWCHPTISFSVIPFSSCLQSLPASGSFPTHHYVQRIRTLALLGVSISPTVICPLDPQNSCSSDMQTTLISFHLQSLKPLQC